MIPKIIHYCWLSGDEFPSLIKKCMDSWKEKLPDYEFILWDTKRFDLESNIWVKQAFETKKYAFAADYIRLFAIYHYGGIYLDTDVEVLKSFNDLLDRPYIVGSEGLGIIEAGVFGAKKNSSWVKQCLDYYSNKTFINTADGSFNTSTLPRIIMSQLSNFKTVEEVLPAELSVAQQQKNDKILYMFPKDFFCAKNHGTGVIEKTTNTYCIHHFAMSWVPKKQLFLPSLKKKIMKVFGVKTVNKIIRITGLYRLREKYYYKKYKR